MFKYNNIITYINKSIMTTIHKNLSNKKIMERIYCNKFLFTYKIIIFSHYWVCAKNLNKTKKNKSPMLLKFNFITNGIIYKISNDIYVSQFVFA